VAGECGIPKEFPVIIDLFLLAPILFFRFKNALYTIQLFPEPFELNGALLGGVLGGIFGFFIVAGIG